VRDSAYAIHRLQGPGKWGQSNLGNRGSPFREFCVKMRLAKESLYNSMIFLLDLEARAHNLMSAAELSKRVT
jgi:hypothetical protein